MPAQSSSLLSESSSLDTTRLSDSEVSPESSKESKFPRFPHPTQIRAAVPRPRRSGPRSHGGIGGGGTQSPRALERNRRTLVSPFPLPNEQRGALDSGGGGGASAGDAGSVPGNSATVEGNSALRTAWNRQNASREGSARDRERLSARRSRRSAIRPSSACRRRRSPANGAAIPRN